jgi:hypothetical protein
MTSRRAPPGGFGRRLATLALLGVAARPGCSSTSPATAPGGDGGPPDTGDDGAVALDSRFDQTGDDAGSDARSEVAAALPRSLFNGVDFSGWDRYLGIPSSGGAPLGIDNDPRSVYSVVTLDGEPAVRISGEVWGALISREELCDFHLRLEYRWGTAVWPPLNAFDSGVMYLSTGALGAVNAGGPALSNPPGSGGFMVSMEYQLTPTDIGGMYNLGPISFQAGARATLAEVPGQWNRIDIRATSAATEHQLNGQPVTSGTGFLFALPGTTAQPLRCGKIQLQSEGGEIFFRRITLLPTP